MKNNTTKTKKLENLNKNEKTISIKSNFFPISDISIGMTIPTQNYKTQNKYLPKHHVLEYILDGEGEVTIDKKTFPIKKHSTIIIKRGTQYSITQNENNPIKKIWIMFSSAYITYMLENYRLTSGVYNINNEYNFKNLMEIINSEKDYSLLFFIANNIHEIITHTASFNLKIFESPATIIKSKLDTLVYEKSSLIDIAKELGMSLSTLSRTFKKTFNISPGQYIIDNKINISKSLLSSSSLPIKNISNMLNFTNEYYFTYYFTKKNGVSPSAYRKQMQM